VKYTFTIPGNPIPLARARINTKAFWDSNKKRMWDPQKELKLVTAITLQNQYEKIDPFSGPVHIDVIFYMPIPQSKSKIKQKELDGAYHCSRPDVSNLLKFIEDASQGVLYQDDCIIASVNIKKVYDQQPRTVFTIESLL
jgi:Holliday junction resolvase RusA-like endonuclease